MTNFVKNLFIDVSLGRTPLLYYDFSRVLKKITSIRLKNKKYIINWYYEDGDEDILEKGECISLSLDLSFNFIKICDPLEP